MSLLGRSRHALGRAARGISPSSRLIETRLGPGATDRAPLHESLDVLDRYGSHLAEQGDRNTRHIDAASDRLASALTHELDQLRAEVQGLRAEIVDQLHASLDPFAAGTQVDLVTTAFVAAALARLPPRREVLLLDHDDLVVALRALELDVVVLDDAPTLGGVRTVTRGAAAGRAWPAVVLLDERTVPGVPAESLVAEGGLLLTTSTRRDVAGLIEERRHDDLVALRRPAP